MRLTILILAFFTPNKEIDKYVEKNKNDKIHKNEIQDIR